MITVAERKKLAKLVLTNQDTTVIEKIKSLVPPRTKANEFVVKNYNKDIDEADILLAEWEIF